MQAIKALHAELMVLTARDVDRRSERNDREEVRSGAVLISGDSKALWRYAQWVIADTYAITRRFSYFRVETGRWIDVDLPDDLEQRPSDPSLRKVTVLTARLFRDNLDRSPAEQYTKIRWDRTEEEVTLRLDERVPDRDRATASRLHADVFALPRADAPPDEHAAAWRQVEDRVADLVEGRSPWIAAVKTPYPKGLAVPYADVVAMLDVFQRLGAGRMRIEGSPPPRVEGGSWVFDEPK